MAAIPVFDPAVLERISEVLADTSSGLTGSEIGRHLGQLGIADPMPGMTKRVRLFEALRLRLDEAGVRRIGIQIKARPDCIPDVAPDNEV